MNIKLWLKKYYCKWKVDQSAKVTAYITLWKLNKINLDENPFLSGVSCDIRVGQ